MAEVGLRFYTCRPLVLTYFLQFPIPVYSSLETIDATSAVRQTYPEDFFPNGNRKNLDCSGWLTLLFRQLLRVSLGAYKVLDPRTDNWQESTFIHTRLFVCLNLG